jgi:DNA-binding transcriptional regulator LsrR (DeoR family)
MTALRAGRRDPRPSTRRLRAAERPVRAAADRADLLADVAEMYYLENKNQNEIARVVGVTRSMVSRMLSEARERGIVEIHIRRQVQADHDLAARLVDCFGLRAAHVVRLPVEGDRRWLPRLGAFAAEAVQPLLGEPVIVGVAWGTAVSALVDAVKPGQRLPIKIVQLVGALGAHNNEYDGHALVSRLAEKTGGESFFLNAPFICPNAEMVESLLQTPSIQETARLNRAVQVLLAGVGSTAPEYSSFYLAGYLPLAELEQLRATGAVGDVCGLHFDGHGRACGEALTNRLVTIRRADLLAVPMRVGVAGGPGKVQSILGALRGGYINVLVTDDQTAAHVLNLAAQGPPPAAPGLAAPNTG